jgi:predicted DNA-binding antitoxin AbrB/MazE fold protein
MRGPQIEAVYEHGILKLPRELPLEDGVPVTITIHPPGRLGALKHLCIPWTGSQEGLERLAMDPELLPEES